jgi:hypothetical protein
MMALGLFLVLSIIPRLLFHESKARITSHECLSSSNQPLGDLASLLNRFLARAISTVLKFNGFNPLHVPT